SKLKQILRILILLPHHILLICLNFIEKLYDFLRPSLLNAIRADRYDSLQNTTKAVTHHSTKAGKFYQFRLFAPNAVCQFRADTFSTKEPETLAWIERFGGKGAFFDIGANVGLYSIYYGLVHPGAVYAFEPSVFNLRLLAQNAYLNQLQDRINIVPNPLTNTRGFEVFRMQNTNEGGAMSSFGVDYGHKGTTLETNFIFRSCGFSLDFLLESAIISEPPRLIKIDVDGIEHLILEGAEKTLRHPSCVSVLIEIDKTFHLAVDRISTLLKAAGFLLLDEVDWGPFGGKETFAKSPNQIWVKQGHAS
ncbi:MAG: FkbM family methyltransferase, partial [Proteobacteria bacterium]|nr:FkbM family methyltransferase [Pseudomonadota bacterium]